MGRKTSEKHLIHALKEIQVLQFPFKTNDFKAI